MSVASVDVGTNTALLLVAEVVDGHIVEIIQEEERFVRLGEGVDAERRIRPAAIERLRQVLETYAILIQDAFAERTVVVGTSASRDAVNVDEIEDLVQRIIGVPYQVLSGEEEAARTFEGAVGMLPHLSGPCAVVDVGGGSTEIVLGSVADHRPVVDSRISTDLGGVRLTERFFREEPPPGSAVTGAREYVDQLLTETSIPPDAGRTLVGTSGTARSLAMIIAGVAGWDEVDGDSLPLSIEDVRTWARRLLSMNTHEVLSLDPRLLGGRADIFPAGVMILEHVMAHLGCEACIVSRGGLREGVALHTARNNR